MYHTKITVIVPLYNAESYLPRCIDSIINQTYSNLQIILIDDGSTDNSGSICDHYALQDTRIEVCHTENRGLVAARKCGLNHANGEYIGFVDADDYIEGNMFEILLKMIIESDSDFVHTGYIQERGENIKMILDFEEGTFDLQNIKDREEFLIKYVLKAESKSTISHSIWSKLYKSELIKKSYAFVRDEYQYGEDLYNLCLCILGSKRISLHRHALYHYVVKENSMSHLKRMEYILKEMELCGNAIRNIEDYSRQIYFELNKYIIDFTIRRLARIIEETNNKVHIQRFYFKNTEILNGKKVIIWGAGSVGQDYYAQLCKYKNIEVVAWFDSNYKQYQFDYADIVGIHSLKDYEFEKIVIAINEEYLAYEIKKMLLMHEQSEEKILWLKPGDLLENE